MAAIHRALPSGVFSQPKREPPSLMVKMVILRGGAGWAGSDVGRGGGQRAAAGAAPAPTGGRRSASGGGGRRAAGAHMKKVRKTKMGRT